MNRYLWILKLSYGLKAWDTDSFWSLVVKISPFLLHNTRVRKPLHNFNFSLPTIPLKLQLVLPQYVLTKVFVLYSQVTVVADVVGS